MKFDDPNLVNSNINIINKRLRPTLRDKVFKPYPILVVSYKGDLSSPTSIKLIAISRFLPR